MKTNSLVLMVTMLVITLTWGLRLAKVLAALMGQPIRIKTEEDDL